MVPNPHTRAIAARAGAGIGAGALVYAGLQTLGPRPQSPAAAAIATALLVALLPRAGWLASAGAFVGWLGWELRDGTALVLLVALAPMPLLLPFAGCAWSIPALAPLLGAIGLGPAYLAIAGLGATPARRIGLGVAGFLWMSVAEGMLADSLEVQGRAAEASVVRDGATNLANRMFLGTSGEGEQQL